jgi:hypothetical protein
MQKAGVQAPAEYLQLRVDPRSFVPEQADQAIAPLSLSQPFAQVIHRALAAPMPLLFLPAHRE